MIKLSDQNLVNINLEWDMFDNNVIEYCFNDCSTYIFQTPVFASNIVLHLFIINNFKGLLFIYFDLTSYGR